MVDAKKDARSTKSKINGCCINWDKLPRTGMQAIGGCGFLAWKHDY